jgi:hypothetical protein
VCKLPLFRKISSLFLHALLAERERFRSWKPHFFHIQLLASLLGGGYTFCQWVRTSSHSWVCVSKLPRQCTHASVYTTTCASSPCNRLATVVSHPLPKLTCAESKPCKSEVCYDFHTQQRYCISFVNEFWSKFVMGTRYILALDNRDIPFVSP